WDGTKESGFSNQVIAVVPGAIENLRNFCEDRGNCVGETLIYAFRVKSSSAVKGPVQPHRISSTAITQSPPASVHLIALPSLILCHRPGTGHCSNTFSRVNFLSCCGQRWPWHLAEECTGKCAFS